MTHFHIPGLPGYYTIGKPLSYGIYIQLPNNGDIYQVRDGGLKFDFVKLWESDLLSGTKVHDAKVYIPEGDK